VMSSNTTATGQDGKLDVDPLLQLMLDLLSTIPNHTALAAAAAAPEAKGMVEKASAEACMLTARESCGGVNSSKKKQDPVKKKWRVNETSD